MVKRLSDILHFKAGGLIPRLFLLHLYQIYFNIKPDMRGYFYLKFLIKSGYPLLLGGIFLNLCCLDDAERNNPLDPKSNDFENVGRVAGQTLTFYSPFTSIATVDIRLRPGTLVTQTDEDGQFTFEKVPVGKYQVSAAKEGYALASDSIEVILGETRNVRLNLDALPVISGFEVKTAHISRWFPQTELFLLEVAAQVSDPDGVNDVALAYLEIPAISFLDTLLVTQEPGIFRQNIVESRIPGRNLQNIIGLPIFLHVQDKVGFETVSTPKFIARIIEQTPVYESPFDDTLDVSNPVLSWRPMNLTFQFTYKVDIFRVDQGIVNQVESIPGINAEEISVQVIQSLPPGDYFWTISVVDEFGNSSRSKEAAFFIN